MFQSKELTDFGNPLLVSCEQELFSEVQELFSYGLEQAGINPWVSGVLCLHLSRNQLVS